MGLQACVTQLMALRIIKLISFLQHRVQLQATYGTGLWKNCHSDAGNGI